MRASIHYCGGPGLPRGRRRDCQSREPDSLVQAIKPPHGFQGSRRRRSRPRYLGSCRLKILHSTDVKINIIRHRIAESSVLESTAKITHRLFDSVLGYVTKYTAYLVGIYMI